MSPRNGGSRSFHSKSRNSCLRCKTRRVKCGLQAPTCTNCYRRSERCVYPSFDGNPSGQIGIVNRAPIPKHSPKSTIAQNAYPEGSHSPERLTESKSLDVSELTFMYSQPKPVLTTPSEYQFLKLSFLNMAPLRPSSPSHPTPGAEEIALWTTLLLKQIPHSPYLTHSLLSLHLLTNLTTSTPFSRSPSPQSNSSVQAYEHHINATQHFLYTNPPTITPQNWVSITTFGISILIFQLASQQTCPDEAFDTVITLRVLRASNMLAQGVFPHLLNSELWKYIYLRSNAPTPQLDEDAQHALSHLEAAIYLRPPLSSNQCTADAVRALTQWVQDCDGYPRQWRHYLAWPAAVSDEYLARVSDGEGAALVILVYWCAFLQRAERRWFMEHWPKRTAWNVIERLGEGGSSEWNSMLEWPRKIFQFG